jgi:hypothetical protein
MPKLPSRWVTPGATAFFAFCESALSWYPLANEPSRRLSSLFTCFGETAKRMHRRRMPAIEPSSATVGMPSVSE